jgi:predicted phage tail protein
MRTVVLHGILAQKFVPKIDLEVSSIPEAIKALSINFSEFANFIVNYKPGFIVKYGNKQIKESELSDPIGYKPIHIIPYVHGKGKGLPLLILGFALMWASGGLSTMMRLEGMGGLVAAPGTAAAMVSQVGLGLVMMGISTILYAPPKPADSQKDDPSKTFSGVVNTTRQGLPVPIGYGTLMVGSAVVSAGIDVDYSKAATLMNYSWIYTTDTANLWSSEVSGWRTLLAHPSLRFRASDSTYECTIPIAITTYGSTDTGIGVEGSEIRNIVYFYNQNTNTFTTSNDYICLITNDFGDGPYQNPSGSAYCEPEGSSDIPPGWKLAATGVA